MLGPGALNACWSKKQIFAWPRSELWNCSWRLAIDKISYLVICFSKVVGCTKYMQGDSWKTSLVETIFSNFAGFLLWIHVQIILNIFMNFKKMFYRQFWLATSFTHFFLTFPFSGRSKENIEKKGVKGALYSVRQYLATESSLKMMKSVFYFTLQALFCSQDV